MSPSTFLPSYLHPLIYSEKVDGILTALDRPLLAKPVPRTRYWATRFFIPTIAWMKL